MKLRLPLLLSVLAAGALLAGSALAGPPDREPVEIEPLEFPAGLVCPFAVRLEPVANKEIAKVFSDRVIITGRLTARVINLENERSLVLNISGPVTITPLADGSTRVVLTGRGLVFLFPTDVGGPGLFLTTGRVVEVLDEEDNVVFLKHARPMRDLCAALA